MTSSNPSWLLRIAAGLLCATTLAACQTTGDPRKGGLLGWNEQQAMERQRALEVERAAAQLELGREKQRGAELTASQSQIGYEVRTLQASLANALGENDALEARLLELMSQRKLADAERVRLQKTLEASRAARAAARLAATNKAAAVAADKLASHSQEMNQYNQQLHSAVMLLMGR